MENNVEDEIDGLFALPLAEFIGARNALAKRLKKSAQAGEAERVKALAKPPVSVWAVNQLYWNYRDAFDRLIAAGQRFREAQAAQLAGKVSDVRGPLDARRETLSDLSHQAAELLRDAGHNPSPDIMRRIATTLEAMSAYTSLPDTLRPGRLTADLDPPGFESIAGLVPGPVTHEVKEVSKARNAGNARLAAAEASLRDAERAQGEARARVEAAQAALREANAQAKDAEERLEKARAASEEAARRARNAAAEAEKAANALEDAGRTFEQASTELRSLQTNPPADE